uniref:EGF-like domain-containing protein n=1 Tax=Biomphalaria glabrata TaxID=6526 RepID=A0A2C9LG05_BIOGL
MSSLLIHIDQGRMVHLLLSRLETWTVSFMSLLCVSAKEFRTDCSRDWFGPNCQFKCRCSTGCSDTGECTSDLTNELDQKEREITDNNDMTCLKDGRESVTLLMSPGPFSFFRAIVNRSDPEKVDSISFELTTDLNTSMMCGKDGRAYKTEPFIKYFHCPTQVSVSHLVLKGSGVPYLCTVNIGGGRNLALKENYTYSSVYSAVTGAGGNDGEIPTNGLFSPATCFHASWTSLISFYQVNFHVPVLINYFVVMSRPETVYSSRLNHFELLTYAEDNNTVMHYTEPTDEDKPGSLVYKVTHTGNNVPIRSFRLQKNHSSIVIQFCEVEAYGDCPPGIQELDCEEECSVKCANQICEASGRCIDCPPGFYGDQCESECLFGTYGPGCKEQCVNCSNDTCDKMTGDCDMCKDGHWDKDCKKVCPPNCVFNVCDQLTSECSDGCTAGYFGPYCEFGKFILM